jgi:hypothetical protein
VSDIPEDKRTDFLARVAQATAAREKAAKEAENLL